MTARSDGPGELDPVQAARFGRFTAEHDRDALPRGSQHAAPDDGTPAGLMTFTGTATALWRLAMDYRLFEWPCFFKVIAILGAVVVLLLAWLAVLAWYVITGPYRIVTRRRGPGQHQETA